MRLAAAICQRFFDDCPVSPRIAATESRSYG
jgi:hypothetical protein